MDMGQLTCQMCKQKANSSDMKYLPNRGDKILVCPKCYGARTLNAVKNEDSSRRTAGNEDIEKTAYVCEKCRYTFRANPFRAIKIRCPYCGSIDKVKEKVNKNASQLLNESMGDEYSF